MCSIFGSYDVARFYELADLNGYRGSHSHSIAAYNVEDNTINIIKRELGSLKTIHLPSGPLYIGHQQAPTTDAKDMNSIHPASMDGHFLWHNGIIKAHQVEQWEDELKAGFKWDTKMLLWKLVYQNYLDSLSAADGSFACVWFNPKRQLSLFRNENCPMFVKGSTFSSTKFEGSLPIDSGYMYQLNNREEWSIIQTESFRTKETFYWSPE